MNKLNHAWKVVGLIALSGIWLGGTAWAQSISITNLGAPIASTVFTPSYLSHRRLRQPHRAGLYAPHRASASSQNDCATSAPWTAPIFVGLPGDGDATFQAIAYDVFGNVVAKPQRSQRSRSG